MAAGPRHRPSGYLGNRRGPRQTSPVTTGPTGAQSPVLSPDGQELIFRGYIAGRLLYRKALRADATASALPDTAEGGIPEQWSHDGQILLYRTSGEENAFWALPVEGGRLTELVLKSAFSVGGAQMSPDGRSPRASASW